MKDREYNMTREDWVEYMKMVFENLRPWKKSLEDINDIGVKKC